MWTRQPFNSSKAFTGPMLPLVAFTLISCGKLIDNGERDTDDHSFDK